MSTAPTPASHLSIQCVNIFVRNHDRSIRFFVDQLGFHLAYDAKLQSGERLVAVAPPDGSTVLALIVPKPKSPEYKLIGRSTNIVLITEDVLGKFQEWSRRGVRFHSTPRLKRLKYDSGPLAAHSSNDAPILGLEPTVWGSAVARFRDIDGNIFILVSFDEVTHALEAQRRAASAKLEADRRAAQELEIATEVQCRFFPQWRPPIHRLDYAGHCYPARAVGGDYYDFLDLGPDRFGLVIGDVSGKGIAAALLMASLQANLRSQCSISLDRLESTATVLGIFKKWDCELGERTIGPGDTLALYTDGITEAFNDSRDEFGEARLIDSLRRHRAQPSQSLLDSIVADVRQFSPREQHDDITLIIAKSSPA